MLQQERCDSGQGFLYARPMDAAAAETFLRTWADRASPEPGPATELEPEPHSRPRNALTAHAASRYAD